MSTTQRSAGRAQFTPGPWRLHDMEEATVVAADRKAVAVTYSRSRSDEENKANAKLIAGVPDLLAGAQILRQIRDLVESFSGGNPQTVLIRELVRTAAAKAAIARATGQE